MQTRNIIRVGVVCGFKCHGGPGVHERLYAGSSINFRALISKCFPLTRFQEREYEFFFTEIQPTIRLRVEFLLKTDRGYRYPRDVGVSFHSRWQTLGFPFASTPIGQPHQSQPSPAPGDRTRSKLRGFSPGAAAHHRSWTRVSTCFPRCFPQIPRELRVSWKIVPVF